MADYRVNLEVFAGPLDLLLYLVRKEEVDIYDIPIARITEQYLHYIEMLKSLDIDLAGEFLVMAATLMQIKSAMLLPKAEPDALDTEELQDPRAELIRQLLEYKKFKDAANLLEAAANEQKERFARPGTIIEAFREDREPELDLEQVSVWDLLEAFDSILQATGTAHDISHIPDDTPIDIYQIELLDRLQSEGPMPFARLFENSTKRLVMIGIFLALLELIRDGLVSAEQQEKNSGIYLAALTNEPAEQAVQNAIIASTKEAERPAQAEQREKLSIPIREIATEPAPGAKTQASQRQPDAAPIVELPAEEKTAAARAKQPNPAQEDS